MPQPRIDATCGRGKFKVVGYDGALSKREIALMLGMREGVHYGDICYFHPSPCLHHHSLMRLWEWEDRDGMRIDGIFASTANQVVVTTVHRDSMIFLAFDEKRSIAGVLHFTLRHDALILRMGFCEELERRLKLIMVERGSHPEDIDTWAIEGSEHVGTLALILCSRF